MNGRMTFLHCVCLTIAGALILALAPRLSSVPPENASAQGTEEAESAASRAGGRPRRTENAQASTSKQGDSRGILRPANLRAVDRRLAPARSAALGAPLPGRLGLDRARNDATQATAYLTTRRIPFDGYPVMPPVVVDYRDDLPSRLRREGKLIGPVPLRAIVTEGGIAAGAPCGGGCTFPIECDDNDPCTIDTCDYVSGQPPSTGSCDNAAVADGLPGDCSDGEFCNGIEVCQSGVCTDGPDPDCAVQVCDEFQDACVDACANDGDCDDGKHCNGIETCVNDVCQPGTNPCGAGAACTEKVCSLNGRPCARDDDCEVEGTFCTVDGPGCFPGRCCLSGDFQTCSNDFRRTKDQGPNQEDTDQCLEQAGGGLFYPTDEGRADGAFGNTCFSEPNQCPQISGGIAPQGPFVQVIGPISDSCALRVPAGSPTQPLNAVIDDYEFVGSDDFYELHSMRWVGGAARIFIEFFDQDGNFIDDTLPLVIFSGEIAIRPIIFTPPIPIPSKGFIRFRNASQFTPGGQLYLATTDTFDVGINDAAVLCLNNEVLDASGGVIPSCTDPGAASTAASSGRLAFEMVGVAAAPPSGACCNHETGTCAADTLPWVCASGTCSNDASNCSRSEDCGEGNTCNTGVYLGDGTLCGLCGADSGAFEGFPCDEIGGADADDCDGGTCVSRCETGACCDLNTGDCLPDRTEAECDALAPSEFLGFGTDCDPNCCEQPVVTGADDCQDAVVHVVNVPTVNVCVGGANDGQPCPNGIDDCPDGIGCALRKVITITGDNSGASSSPTSPDTCLGFNETVGTDPGWFEAFAINDCAYVRIDHCCTDPIHLPAYSILYDTCNPCGPAIFARPNPHAFDETLQNALRGEPYCDADNLWSWFGPLTAGTYFFPVFSGVAGHLGSYQLHITVDACPRAACCQTGGETCVGGTDGRNILDCEAEGGFYLGPPNRFPIIVAKACDGGICDDGSCCAPELGAITGPGSCRDNIAVEKMTLSNCDLIFGDYIGGIRCKGGTCDNIPVVSCDKDEDCPIGPCVGEVLLFAQPTPCPLCEIEGSNNCQAVTTTAVQFDVSELTLGGLTVADDFTPNGNVLTTVCTSGLYINTFDAADSSETGCRQRTHEQMLDPQDKMRITIYEDDNGLPGDVFAVRYASKTGDLWGVANEGTVARKELPFGPNSVVFGADDLTDEEYQIDISADPIEGLITDPPTIYWIEIINNMDEHEECIWLINHSDAGEGNAYAAPGAGGVFAGGAPYDLTFCLNFDFTIPDPPTGGCCTCADGLCVADKTLVECNRAEGGWFTGDNTCGGSCIAGAPVNDLCENMLMIGPGLDIDGDPTSESAVTWETNHFCATTSLPNIPVCTDFSGTCDTKCGGATGDVVGQDLWYGYVAPADGTGFISMCQTGTVWDSMFAIYRGPEGADDGTGNTCPCPTDIATCNTFGYEEGGVSLEISSDEGCYKAAVGGPGTMVREFKANTCYVLQVGAWGPTTSTPGLGFISLQFQTLGPVDPPTADPAGFDMSRYLPFEPGNAGVQTALRVTLTASNTFPGAVGQQWWVAAPDSVTGRASLQCAPDYRNRGLDPSTIYVGHANIHPDATFDVQAIDIASDIGVEGNYSAALSVSTNILGDINGGGNTNFTDIGRALDTFKSNSLALRFERANIDPEVIQVDNEPVTAMDVRRVIQSFQLQAYPFGAPRSCDFGAAICGNSILDEGEECDDGGTVPGDGCDSNCEWERSGEILLVPISATGSHSINGQEITLDGEQRVTLEVFLRGWDPDQNSDPLLTVVQAQINSSGYTSGSSGTLAPAQQACGGNNDCEDFVGDGSTCTVPVGAPTHCTAGFVESQRGDHYLDPLEFPLEFVDISTLDYRFAGMPGVQTTTGVADSGGDGYLGTLVLDISGDAAGLFTVGFDASGTFFVDQADDKFGPITLTPAQITVTGDVDCCNGTTCQTLTLQQCTDGGGTVVAQCLGDNDESGGDDACEVNCCVGSACQPESPQQCFDIGGTEVPLCLGDGNGNGEDDACEGPIVIPPGDDCWRTECGRTQFSFCDDPIPADFFGTGSLPYTGILGLGGGGAGASDTSMRRLQEMTLDQPPSVDSTPIELVALNLLSCQPITVDFSDSTTKDWHVSVQLSGVAPPQGTLTVTRTHFNGGTFDAEFSVQPVFTFTGVADSNDVRILDTGALGLPPSQLNTVASAPWVHALAAGSTVTICGTNFAPGVEEDPETGDQCCRKVGHSAGPGSPPGHIHETAPPNCTACPSGACCLPGGVCQVADPLGGQTAQEVCEDNLGGQYKGDSTDCTDSDGDGLADVRESSSGCGACPAGDLCNLGTDPTRSDTDGDGCSDLEEVAGGSDPCDPCDSLVACALPLEDCNNDGIADACTSPTNDCNNDGIEDDCQEGACCYIVDGPVCFIGPKTGPFPSCESVGGLWYGPCATCDSFQNAVEVVEDGGQIFLHQVGSPEACPSELDGQGGTAGACTGPLVDAWVSKPSEGTMCHNFGANGGGPIPADFFCPNPGCGSDPFDSVVCLEGVPLGATQWGDFGDADTLILRTDDPFDRCALPSTTALSVDIEVVALSLVNVDPITVTFNGGQTPELWDVAVDLSTTVTPTAGELTATKTHCNGGTYVSTLNVQPRFTFTRQSDNLVRVFDTGTQGLSHITLSQNDPAPWVHDVDPNFGIAADPCSQFHAGIEELLPLSDCDCNSNGTRDKCDVEVEESLDCNDNGIPDECELTDNDCNTNGIPDDCETDCNNNGVPDECDVDDSDPDGDQFVSSDCNNNGVPDECEPDCNQNDVPDSCDVDGSDPDGNGQVSADCNGNGIPDECEADCNHNDIPDACDLLVFFTSEDCTGNNRPDECDIRSGVSRDCNGNAVPDECELVGNDQNNDGVPDECEIFVPEPLRSASNPFGIPGGSDLNRAGGFAIPASAVAGGQEVAIRIRLVDLYVDSDEDAINGCPVRAGLPDLTLFDNQIRFLGPPSAFDDNDIASTPKFIAAELQCAPYYRDWSSAGLTAEFGAGVDTATVYFYGAEVLPCSVYEAQQGTQACVEFPSELCFSTALEIRTGLWGDLWPPLGDVSFTDIGKIVDAFKSIPFVPGNPPEGAPRKVRAMVRGKSAPFDSAINFTDIGKIVDAFKTIAYAEDGPTLCP